MKLILIVEDNPVNRELIREVLEAKGFSVVEAGDGEVALKVLRESKPGLAIIDIQMPKLSGLQLIQQIREDQQIAGTKCIALTAYAMSGDRERVIEAGFDAYVPKPFESKELIQTVRELLDGQ